jgi:hypothetical protein
LKSDYSSLRGDYAELMKLTILYLSNDKPNFTFQKPGALHKARWMAKLLYSIKMNLLQTKIMNELPKGSVFRKGQEQKVSRFVKFVVFVYFPWWITCSSAKDAPVNDCKFIAELLQYSQIDQQISASATKAFKSHLWYLTEELVPLALFSSKINDSEKEKRCCEILKFEKNDKFQNRYGTNFGKPSFPSPEPRDLHHFIGQDSWLTFDVLNLQTDFLREQVKDWKNCDSFQVSQQVVNNLRVVNDTAERGVKLASDFLSGAQIEKRYQNVLQVVENDHQRVPNQRKRKRNGKEQTWFLSLE